MMTLMEMVMQIGLLAGMSLIMMVEIMNGILAVEKLTHTQATVLLINIMRLLVMIG